MALASHSARSSMSYCVIIGVLCPLGSDERLQPHIDQGLAEDPGESR